MPFIYEQGGVVGDWGPDVWGDPGGYTANNGPSVMANDVLTQSTVTEGADRWTGFFQNLIGDVTRYAVQKDAMRNGLVPATAANGQPVYTAGSFAQPASGVSTGTVLLILAGVVGVVLLTSKG